MREKDSGRRGMEPKEKKFLHPSVWGLTCRPVAL